MYSLLAVVVFILALTVSLRSRDQVVASCAAVIWIGGTIAFVARWVTGYYWVNQSGCREAFPEYFGYRGPNYERPPYPVQDDRSWWPMGHRCSGPDSDTGQFVSVDPGWGLSTVVYSALAAMVVSVIVLAVRLVAVRARS